MTTKILKVKVPDNTKDFELWLKTGKDFNPIEIPLTPAELQAVITLITLNESECVYAHPLLKLAKEKLERIMK